MEKDQTTTSAAQIAADVVNKAAETAQVVVNQAAEAAKNVVISDASIKEALTGALRDVFGENQSSGRFIDVTRIPLLCKSVIDTNKRLEGIETKLDNKFVTAEAFSPIKNVVYGMVGIILTGVAAIVLSLVFRK